MTNKRNLLSWPREAKSISPSYSINLFLKLIVFCPTCLEYTKSKEDDPLLVAILCTRKKVVELSQVRADSHMYIHQH